MKLHLGLLALLLAGLCPAFSFAETITVPIIAFDDDAEQDLDLTDPENPMGGNVQRTSSDLELGNQNLTLQLIGLRFQGINIPAGSVINSASIQFTANEVDFGSLTIPIFGELSPDPVAFANFNPLSSSMPIFDRTRTTATTSWVMGLWDPNPMPSTPDDILFQRPTSPDLSPIVQEIIDQDGWISGNPIAFILLNDMDTTETSERIAYSFDATINNSDPAIQPPVLTIDFTPSAVLLGDCDLNEVVNFLDVSPFIENLTAGTYLEEADCNEDDFVNFLDIAPFIAILGGN